uniref:ATPase family AAA domain-containing protein 2 n=1 Tax=Petromyzon marinus TaxID=7757 RepID=A0AAJ7TCJ0_PETMA|nr:ATPase family AAA domain-containing protein 2B isoform X1 [Petromyzon marinus]
MVNTRRTVADLDSSTEFLSLKPRQKRHEPSSESDESDGHTQKSKRRRNAAPDPRHHLRHSSNVPERDAESDDDSDRERERERGKGSRERDRDRDRERKKGSGWGRPLHSKKRVNERYSSKSEKDGIRRKLKSGGGGGRASFALGGKRSTADGELGHKMVNGGSGLEVRRSQRVKQSRYASLNQSLLDEQYITNSPVVLQDFDKIGNQSESNLHSSRCHREIEKLRLWQDTEDVRIGFDPSSVDVRAESMDMYSRVKRKRRIAQQDDFEEASSDKESSEGEGEEGQTEDSHEAEGDVDADGDEDEDEDEEDEEEEVNEKTYFLRKRKVVQRYQAPPIEPVARRPARSGEMYDVHRSPVRRRYTRHAGGPQSPYYKRRKRHAINSSDSTSSSSSSSDEERFDKRMSKSMARARNRCLPMNLKAEDLASGVLRERTRVGASLADVDPMSMDSSIGFHSIGGLSRHIQALKEMIVFPLLYPEIFQKYSIQPPRGCLFHGPPGTGKTLVARALANECSRGDRRMAFFMRKGADCLSKWVGESERQLRLLFDQAYLMRPSIIFFDEIDGLAPVRSSRQDQIHSSIVSTLLALMDGLDSRGEIVVIGATNRLDSIDPALRRPGRFDREFMFNLPDVQARRQILEIHTCKWTPHLSNSFMDELAEKCVGYCGADVKALCTEAVLSALRRRYPQIYATSERLLIDPSSVSVATSDFQRAMDTVVPASQRAVVAPGAALGPVVRPLLATQFMVSLERLLRVFPHGRVVCCNNSGSSTAEQGLMSQMLFDDPYSDEEDAPSIFQNGPLPPNEKQDLVSMANRPFLNFSSSVLRKPSTHRPRLLLAGDPGSGQSSHIAPALIHSLEKLPVHKLDLPLLYGVSARTPEESCAQVFREARRTAPSVIFTPHIDEWWETVPEAVRATFKSLLYDVPPFMPVLLLATAETRHDAMPAEVQQLFRPRYGEVVMLQRPGGKERRTFFQDLLLNQAVRAPPTNKMSVLQALEVLPLAPCPEPRKLSAEELQRLEEQEQDTLRELRLFLRDVTNRLATDNRFRMFTKPVDIEEVSDYLDVVRQPMDLSTVRMKIDQHKYETTRQFLDDITLICSNALDYNPDKDPSDRMIRHRACAIKDTTYAIMASELDPEFEKLCEEIHESRTKRGVVPAMSAPECYTVRTLKKKDSEAVLLASAETSVTNTSSPVVKINPYKKKPKRRIKWSRGVCCSYKKARLPAPANASSRKDTDVKSEKEEADDKDDEVEDTLKDTAEKDDGADTSDNHETELSMDITGQEEDSHDSRDAADGRSGTGKEDNANGAIDGGQQPVLNGPLGGNAVSIAELDSDTGELDQLDESAIPIIDEAGEEEADTEVSGSGEAGNGEAAEEGKADSLVNKEEANPARSSLPPLDPAAGDNGANDRLAETNGDASASKDAKALADEKDESSRSQRAQMEQQRAIDAQKLRQVLEEPVLPVIVDRDKLKALLDRVVTGTDASTVEELERLYAILSQCVYNHRRENNKMALVQEMESEVETFLSGRAHGTALETERWTDAFRARVHK